MGGYLNQHLGWRTAFFVVGIPGMIFSILFFASVKEPRRGATDVNATSTTGDLSVGKVLKQLYSTNTFVYLGLATGLHVFCIYGLLNWAPSFLSRLHGMKNSEIGALLGPIFGIGGAIGSFAGGFLTDPNRRWFRERPEFQKDVEGLIPMARLGEPHELGPLALYLASEASSYMTGSLVVLDGGYTVW
jgi:predicted MFS family arabinose efflux permease